MMTLRLIPDTAETPILVDWRACHCTTGSSRGYGPRASLCAHHRGLLRPRWRHSTAECSAHGTLAETTHVSGLSGAHRHVPARACHLSSLGSAARRVSRRAQVALYRATGKGPLGRALTA